MAETMMKAARPVWAAGRETEKNLTIGLRRVMMWDGNRTPPVQLRIAAWSRYRAFVNGKMVAHGPTRGPHAWYRIDEWDLTPHLTKGDNLVVLEVVGYNINSFYLVDEPSFVQAEIVRGGTVLAATLPPGSSSKVAPFEVFLPVGRLQKVARYSFQRPFTEVYRLKPGDDDWRTDQRAVVTATPVAETPAKRLLPHHVPLPTFPVVSPSGTVAEGTARRGDPPSRVWRDRSFSHIGPQLRGFRPEELETDQSLEIQSLVSTKEEKADEEGLACSAALAGGRWRIFDFGVNRTGFIGLRATCTEPTTLYLTFDEILTGSGDVSFQRMGCINAVTWHLAPGTYELESLEPYTFRYLKAIAMDGAATVEGLYLRELTAPDSSRAEFRSSDTELNAIFEAARETYRQNAVDVFMDCPSRERAGWLCDSFFTARVALDLTGHTAIERNMYENYLLPEKFAHLPDGMLPMCYPSDHDDGVFIANWAMWFVVQLEEYAARGGDKKIIAGLEKRIEALFRYLGTFKNSDGLLEKLPSWVFVEWSKANSFVQDVNYPSNMLYAGTVDAAGRLYKRQEWRDEAAKVRETIRRQSFNGEYFVDNAVRENGVLKTTTNRSETCQYYAFFFEAATPQTHAALWKRLVSDFGPGRKKTGAHPEIHPSNAFIGNYLRLEILSRYGERARLLDEVHGYFAEMARVTGTLWENDSTSASCNHGFASHVAHVLLRDVLGIRAVDPVTRTVTIGSPNGLPLRSCAGKVPVSGGFIETSWETGKPEVTVKAPKGWKIRYEKTTA
jgi:alpha-L-rhamnosidase